MTDYSYHTVSSIINAFKKTVNFPLKPHSHCADVATVHPDAGQPVYRDAPEHIP